MALVCDRIDSSRLMQVQRTDLPRITQRLLDRLRKWLVKIPYKTIRLKTRSLKSTTYLVSLPSHRKYGGLQFVLCTTPDLELLGSPRR